MIPAPLSTAIPAAGLLVLWGVQMAVAADAPPDFSFFGSFIRMLAALAVVVGLILLLYYAANRWLPHLSPAGGIKRYIRVLETRPMGPRQTLILVEVGGEYLLIAGSPTGLTFIKQVDMIEEIEIVEEPFTARPQKPAGDRFRNLLTAMLQRKAETAHHASPGGRP